MYIVPFCVHFHFTTTTITAPATAAVSATTNFDLWKWNLTAWWPCIVILCYCDNQPIILCEIVWWINVSSSSMSGKETYKLWSFRSVKGTVPAFIVFNVPYIVHTHYERHFAFFILLCEHHYIISETFMEPACKTT